MGAPLRELLAAFDVNVDLEKLDQAMVRIDAFKGTIKKTIQDLKSGFSFESFGLGELIGGLQEQAESIDTAMARTGVGAEDVQRLMFQTGASAEDLGTAFRTLQKNMGLATAGMAGAKDGLGGLEDDLATLPGSGKKAQQLFKALGISLDEVNTSGPGEMFQTIADKIGKMGSAVERNRAAVIAFGPDGPRLLKDAEAMHQLGLEYDAVGGFSEETLAKFKELGFAQRKSELGWNKIRILLAEQFLPVVIRVQSIIAWFVQGFAKVTEKSNSWQLAAGAIGVALLVMNAGMLRFLASTLRAAAPWIALFLVVEDIVTFFRGGKSVVGEFVDQFGKLFGIQNAGKEAQKAFQDLVNFISNHSLSEVWDQFKEDTARIWKFGIPDSVKIGFQLITGLGGLELKAWLTDLGNRFRDWGADLARMAILNAQDLIQGLVDGITGGASRVLDAITGLGTGLVKAFRNAVGSHSPSVKFRAATLDAGEGAIQGFEASGPRVQQAAADMLDVGSLAPPTLPRSGGAGGSSTVQVTQTNHNTIQINAGRDAASVAAATRDGAAQAFNDDRRATLAALEALAPA